MCYQFSLTNVDAQSVINWTAVSQHSWQYVQAPTVSLLFITVIVKLCLQNGFVVRVFFATAGACIMCSRIICTVLLYVIVNWASLLERACYSDGMLEMWRIGLFIYGVHMKGKGTASVRCMCKNDFWNLYAVVFSKLLGHFCVSQTNSKTLDCSWLGLDTLFWQRILTCCELIALWEGC